MRPSDAGKFQQFVEQALHFIGGGDDALKITFQTVHVAGKDILFDIAQKAADRDQR